LMLDLDAVLAKVWRLIHEMAFCYLRDPVSYNQIGAAAHPIWSPDGAHPC
jgi:hypothetical protein